MENPPRTQFLPFHAPDISEDEIQAVVETLRSGWLTTGLKVRQFEAEFARYIGCRQAIAVNSGTAALHLALEAVGVTQGDEVLVPTLTFTATAEVVVYQRAKPVLVDCRPDTYNIDPDQIERTITPRTKAVHSGSLRWSILRHGPDSQHCQTTSLVRHRRRSSCPANASPG